MADNKKDPALDDMSDDEFLASLDSDSDLEGFNVDSEGIDSDEERGPAGKQQSVYKRIGNVGRKAGAGAATGIAKSVEKGLPNTVAFADATKGTISELNRLKDDVIDQVTPVLRETKRTASKLLNQVGDELPKGLVDRLNKWLTNEEEESDRQPSKEEARNNALQTGLAEIFKVQAEERSFERRADEVNRVVDQRLTESRHAESMGSMNGLLNQAMFHTSFLRTTYTAYLKKDLELKYRSLYLQEDLLELTRIQGQMLESRLDAIRHNTGLPDSQKIHLSEIATSNLKNKAVNWFQNQTSDFVGSMSKKLMENYVTPALENLGMFNEIGSTMLESMESAGEKTSLKGIIKGTLIGGAGKIVGGKIGKSLISKLPPEVRKSLENLSELGPQAIIDKLYRMREGMDEAPMAAMDILSALLPEKDLSAGKFSNKVLQDPDAPGVISRRFTHTVEEIIPGFLAKQTALLTQLVTGKPAEELMFDFKKNTFVTTSDYSKRVVAEAFGTKEQRAARAKGIADEMRGIVGTIGDQDDIDKNTNAFNKMSTDMVRFIQNVAKFQYGGFSYKRLASLGGDPFANRWGKAAFKGLKKPKEVLDYFLRVLRTEDGIVNVEAESAISLAIERERKNAVSHRQTLFNEVTRFGGSKGLAGVVDVDQSGQFQISDKLWLNINDDITAEDIAADKQYVGVDQYGFAIEEDTAYDKLMTAGKSAMSKTKEKFKELGGRFRASLLSFGKKHKCEDTIRDMLNTFDKAKGSLKTNYGKLKEKVSKYTAEAKAKVFKTVYEEVLSKKDEIKQVADLIFNEDKSGFKEIDTRELVDYINRHPKVVEILRDIHDKASTSDAYALLFMLMPDGFQVVAQSGNASDLKINLERYIKKAQANSISDMKSILSSLSSFGGEKNAVDSALTSKGLFESDEVKEYTDRMNSSINYDEKKYYAEQLAAKVKDGTIKYSDLSSKSIRAITEFVPDFDKGEQWEKNKDAFAKKKAAEVAEKDKLKKVSDEGVSGKSIAELQLDEMKIIAKYTKAFYEKTYGKLPKQQHLKVAKDATYDKATGKSSAKKSLGIADYTGRTSSEAWRIIESGDKDAATSYLYGNGSGANLPLLDKLGINLDNTVHVDKMKELRGALVYQANKKKEQEKLKEEKEAKKKADESLRDSKYDSKDSLTMLKRAALRSESYGGHLKTKYGVKLPEAVLNSIKKKLDLSTEEAEEVAKKVQQYKSISELSRDTALLSLLGAKEKKMSDLRSVYSLVKSKNPQWSFRYASGGTVDLATGEPIGLVNKPTPLANGKAVAGEHGAEVVVPLNRTKAAWKAFIQALRFHLGGKSTTESAKVDDKIVRDKTLRNKLRDIFTLHDETDANVNTRSRRKGKKKEKELYIAETSKYASKNTNINKVAKSWLKDVNSVDEGQSQRAILIKQLQVQKGMLHLLAGGSVKDLAGGIGKRLIEGVWDPVSATVHRVFNATKKLSGVALDAATTIGGATWKTAKSVGSFAWNRSKDVYKLAGKGLGGVRSAASSFFTLYTDVYRADNLEKPIVFGKELESGQVVEAGTGKKIRCSYAIRKPMVYADTPLNQEKNRVGNYAISEDDLAIGLTDYKGRSLKSLLRSMGSLSRMGISKAWDMGVNFYTKLLPKAAGWVSGKVWGAAKWAGKKLKTLAKMTIAKKDPYVDVYTKNKDRGDTGREFGKPLITGKGIREGLYCYMGNGLPVTSAYGITGAVCAKSNPNQVLITEDDIKAGLVDAEGKSLSKFAGRSLVGKLGAMAWGTASAYGKLLWKTAKAGFNIAKGVAKGGWDFITGGIGGNIKRFLEKIKPLSREDLEDVVGLRLDKIYDLLSGDFTRRELKERTEEAEKKKQEAQAKIEAHKKENAAKEAAHEAAAAERNANRKGSYADLKEAKNKVKESFKEKYQEIKKKGAGFGLGSLFSGLFGKKKDGEEGEDGGFGISDYLMANSMGKYVDKGADYAKNKIGKGANYAKGKMNSAANGIRNATKGVAGKVGGIAKGIAGSSLVGKAGSLLGGVAGTAARAGGALLGGAGSLLGGAGSLISGTVGVAGSLLGGVGSVVGAVGSAAGGLLSAGAGVLAALGPVGLAIAGVAAAGLAAYGLYKIFTDSQTVTEWKEKRYDYSGVTKIDENMVEDFEDDVIEIFDGERAEFTHDELERWAVKFGFLEENSFWGFTKTLGSSLWDMVSGDGITGVKNLVRSYADTTKSAWGKVASKFKGTEEQEKEDRELKIKFFSNWYGARFRPVFNAYASIVRKYSGGQPGDNPDPDDIPESSRGHAQGEFDKYVKTVLKGEITEYEPTVEAWEKYKAKHKEKVELSRTHMQRQKLEKANLATRDEITEAAKSQDDSFLSRMWDNKSRIADAMINGVDITKPGTWWTPLHAVAGIFQATADTAFMADSFNKVRVLGEVGNEVSRKHGILDIVKDFEKLKDRILRGEIPELDKKGITEWANKFGFEINTDIRQIDIDSYANAGPGKGAANELSKTIELNNKKLAFFNTWYSNRFHPIYSSYFNIVRVYANQADITRPTDHDLIPDENRDAAMKELHGAIQRILAKPGMAYFVPDLDAFNKAEAANEAIREAKKRAQKDAKAAAKAREDKEKEEADSKYGGKNFKDDNSDALKAIDKAKKETSENIRAMRLTGIVEPGKPLDQYDLIALERKIPELRKAKQLNYNSASLKAIAELEKYTMEILDEKRVEFSDDEIESIAKSFGFSSNVADRDEYLIKYFTTWYVKRFRPMYEMLRKSFEQEVGYTDTFNVSDLTKDQIDGIVNTWNASCKVYLQEHREILHLGTDANKVSKEQVEVSKDLSISDITQSKDQIERGLAEKKRKEKEEIDRLKEINEAKQTQIEETQRLRVEAESRKAERREMSTLSTMPMSRPTSSSAGSFAANDSSFANAGTPVNVNLGGLSAADIPDGGGGDLGSYVKQFESGKRGSAAIGYDSTGGTSYGTYQFAAKTGSLLEFLKWAKTKGKFGESLYNDMMKAGTFNTGSTGGAAPDVWRKYASVENGTALNKLEHGHIHAKFYLSALKGIKNPDAKNLITKDRGLQEALWSTSIQHGPGGARSIFNATYTNGISAADWLRAIYAKRGTKFGSSKPNVRQSVLNRFKQELPIVLGLSKSAPAVQEGSQDNPTDSANAATTSAPDGQGTSSASSSEQTTTQSTSTSTTSADTSSSASSTTDTSVPQGNSASNNVSEIAAAAMPSNNSALSPSSSTSVVQSTPTVTQSGGTTASAAPTVAAPASSAPVSNSSPEHIALLKTMISVLESIRDGINNSSANQTNARSEELIAAIHELTTALQSSSSNSTSNTRTAKSKPMLDTRKRVA